MCTYFINHIFLPFLISANGQGKNEAIEKVPSAYDINIRGEISLRVHRQRERNVPLDTRKWGKKIQCSMKMMTYSS